MSKNDESGMWGGGVPHNPWCPCLKCQLEYHGRSDREINDFVDVQELVRVASCSGGDDE